MKASEFVGYLFLARDVAHSAHLATPYYAQHKALQEFYEGIVEVADKFAEAYQGRHGLIGPVALQRAEKNSNIVEFLQDSLDTIEGGRYEVAERSDTPIQNIIDEICGVYLSALYKLRHLS